MSRYLQQARLRYVEVADDEHALGDNPAARVVLLYGRIIHWVGQAIVQTQRGDAADAMVDKALQAINLGLRPWIDHQRGGEISQQLVASYDWMERQLLLFRLKRDPALLQEVLGALLTLQEGWQGVAEQATAPTQRHS